MLSSLKTALTWGGTFFVFFSAIYIIGEIVFAVMEHQSIMEKLKKDFVPILRGIFSSGVVIAAIRFLIDVLGAYW